MFTLIQRILLRARGAFWSIALWTFFLGMSLLPSSLGLGRDKPQRPASGTDPVWRFDLHSVGYPGHISKPGKWRLESRANPLCFSTNDVLIASFITQEDVATLARRDRPNDPLPLKLHAAFLDVATGKFLTTRAWFTAQPVGGIIAVGGGRFDVFTPRSISLYSPAVELQKQFPLSFDEHFHFWSLYPSPTGKSILVEYHNPESSFQWIDSSTLQPQHTWNEVMGFVSISDKELAFQRETYTKSGGAVDEVLIRAGKDPSRILCRAQLAKGERCGVPQFVSDEVLVFQLPHEFKLASTTNGDIFFKAMFPDNEWLGGTFPSAGGKRFALVVSSHKEGSAFLDRGFRSVPKRIQVYDIQAPKPVYIIDADKQRMRDVSGVAVSPDGSLMAVLTDGVVEVYQLPSGHAETVGLKDGAVEATLPASKLKQ